MLNQRIFRFEFTEILFNRLIQTELIFQGFNLFSHCCGLALKGMVHSLNFFDLFYLLNQELVMLVYKFLVLCQKIFGFKFELVDLDHKGSSFRIELCL